MGLISWDIPFKTSSGSDKKMFNPNPDGRERICPDYFQRHITKKKAWVKINRQTEENVGWTNAFGNIPLKKRRFIPV